MLASTGMNKKIRGVLVEFQGGIFFNEFLVVDISM